MAEKRTAPMRARVIWFAGPRPCRVCGRYTEMLVSLGNGDEDDEELLCPDCFVALIEEEFGAFVVRGERR